MWTLPDPANAHDSRFTLTMGARRFVVDAAVGGRIVEFSLYGNNVLCDLEDLGDWTNGGSTFWTSPQRDWNWPPNADLDRAPYSVEFDTSAQRLSLRSPRFSLGGSELSVTKHFSANPEQECVDIEYVIENHSKPTRIAGWEVSRVAPEGVTFFAGTELQALGGLPAPTLDTDASSVVWMNHAEQPLEAKLGAHATEGFVAYQTRRLLFVKTFHDVPKDKVFDGEADVELYVMPTRYVEIEQQSAAELLGPGQSLGYRLKWFLRELPEAFTPGTTRSELYELVRKLHAT